MPGPKNILIVSFTFPPAPGIGGRRWAKFAKYLHRRGNHVHVIAAESFLDGVSEWKEDVVGLKVTRLPSGFPAVFSGNKNAFLKGLRYRIAGAWLRLRTKGNYFDRSVNFRNVFLKTAERIIREENISHVITTGAPFHLLAYSLSLRQKFPSVKFISDFRDLWTTETSIGSIRSLSPRRLKFEQQLEKWIVNHSDLVTTVTQPITDYFRSLATDPRIRFATLENGYDPDDFSDLQENPVTAPGDRIRVVFTGTFYPKMENLWNPFILALSDLKKKSPSRYQRLVFDFYGRYEKEYQQFASSNKVDCVHFHGEIGLKEVFRQIRDADLCLLILHDLFSFTLSTKFCEYLSQHKKIIVLSRAGETPELITKNNLGYWIDPRNVGDCLNRLFEEWDHGNGRVWDPLMDISYYSVEKLTLRLESLL